MISADNQGHVKPTSQGVLGMLIVLSGMFVKSKFLFLALGLAFDQATFSRMPSTWETAGRVPSYHRGSNLESHECLRESRAGGLDQSPEEVEAEYARAFEAAIELRSRFVCVGEFSALYSRVVKILRRPLPSPDCRTLPLAGHVEIIALYSVRSRAGTRLRF